jgi:hypothetical protein
MACCFVMGAYAMSEDESPMLSIFRRDPTPEELDDENCIVIDVGRQFSPASNNFDHHQFTSDQEEHCALTLILGDLGKLDDARRVFPWVDFTTMMDVHGPYATADWLGIDRYYFFRVLSPLEEADLRMFGSKKAWTYADPLWSRMIQFGVGQLTHMAKFTNRLHDLSTVGKVVETASGVHVLAVLVPSLSDPALAMSAYRDDLYQESRGKVKLAVSITPDDRSESKRPSGWALFRFNDDPRIDFSKIGDRPEILFAHAGGFVAKTYDRLELPRLIELIEAATRK